MIWTVCLDRPVNSNSNNNSTDNDNNNNNDNHFITGMVRLPFENGSLGEGFFPHYVGGGLGLASLLSSANTLSQTSRPIPLRHYIYMVSGLPMKH